jgi:hypothetical protein
LRIADRAVFMEKVRCFEGPASELAERMTCPCGVPRYQGG